MCSQKFSSHFSCPTLPPPPPNPRSDGFPLEFVLKGPQTELRTNSPKIANKQNHEQTEVSVFLCGWEDAHFITLGPK